jgi:hypothetical protein
LVDLLQNLGVVDANLLQLPPAHAPLGSSLRREHSHL